MLSLFLSFSSLTLSPSVIFALPSVRFGCSFPLFPRCVIMCRADADAVRVVTVWCVLRRAAEDRGKHSHVIAFRQSNCGALMKTLSTRSVKWICHQVLSTLVVHGLVFTKFFSLP